jgi:SAM-dependent methyltransferase
MTGTRDEPAALPERFRGRPRLNLGCGRSADPAWINVDAVALPGVDLVLDLNACRPGHFPLPDGCIEGFFLSHVLEHIPNTLPLMEELHRVAKTDAVMTVRLPHGASDEAWEDPTHVRAYFPGSFGYFAQPYYWRADYGYRGDWQVERIILVVDGARAAGLDDAELGRRLAAERNWVLEMIADLRAVKPVRAPLRELQVPPRVELRRLTEGSAS